MVEKLINGLSLVDVRGRITWGPETEALRSTMQKLFDRGQTRVIMDLGEVTYIDSAGLATLIANYTTARRLGGDLKLLHLPRGVHQLLQITRLITVFDVFEDLESALRSFAAPAPEV